MKSIFLTTFIFQARPQPIKPAAGLVPDGRIPPRAHAEGRSTATACPSCWMTWWASLFSKR